MATLVPRDRSGAKSWLYEKYLEAEVATIKVNTPLGRYVQTYNITPELAAKLTAELMDPFQVEPKPVLLYLVTFTTDNGSVTSAVSTRHGMADVQRIVDNRRANNPREYFLMLDGVKVPQNFTSMSIEAVREDE